MDANPSNFPKRNRIVSGISDAVLVVEAEYRSGTSITAKYAKEQGKIICCLPSNVDNKCGIGTNRLIQQGANLVIKPNEVLELLNQKGLYKNEKIIEENEKLTNKESIKNSKDNNKVTKQENIQIQSIPKEYETIYNIIKETSIHINDICKISKKNISQLMPILTILELEGFIEQTVGNKFKIREN